MINPKLHLMSTSILSPRWKGRLIGSLFSIASQNHIDLQSEGNLTFGNLLNKVLPNASPEDQKLINLLIDRFNAAHTAEMAAGRSFAPEEDQRLVNQGIAEVKLCIQLYGNLQRINTEEDFAATKNERHRQEVKRNQRKLFTFLGILSAVVLAAFIYNLPVFREMRLYSKIEKERSYDLTSKYRIEFPDGKHIEEVYLIEVEETGDPTQPVRDYVARFPKGKYVDRAYLTGVGKMDNPLDLLKDYMEHFQLVGGSATDFRPVFAHVAELQKAGAFTSLRGLIYFTDGMGIYPRKRPPYDTAFVLLEEPPLSVKMPPWAIRLVVDLPGLEKAVRETAEETPDLIDLDELPQL